jgi:hypothetical protein
MTASTGEGVPEDRPVTAGLPPRTDRVTPAISCGGGLEYQCSRGLELLRGDALRLGGS